MMSISQKRLQVNVRVCVCICVMVHTHVGKWRGMAKKKEVRIIFFSLNQ